MIDPSIPLQASPGPAPLNPVQTLAGIGQIRAQQQEGQIRDQQLAMNQSTMDAQKRAQVEDQRLREIFAKGIPSAGELYSTVGPVRGNEILKGLAAMRTEQLKSSTEIKAAVGSMAGGILALPPTMQEDAYTMARQNLLTRGAQPEDIPEQFPGPEGLKQFQVWAMSAKEQVDAAAPKLQSVAPGASVIDEKHPENGPLYTAPPKAPDVGTFEDYLVTYARDTAKKPVAALTASDKEKARQKWTDAGRDQSTDAAVELTPAALDLTAKQFAMTGLLPPMGMGAKAAAARTKIINRAADMYNGLDLATQVAAFKANKDSLAKIQGQRDAIGAFEETALKNLQQFITQAKKVSDTGSPFLNKPIRSIAENLFGSADMAAFNVARRTVIPEFAKILANPGLSGQLSDSARKEIEDVVSGDATLAQTLSAANVLVQDTTNRRTSYDDQIKAIQKRIATPPGGASTSDRLRVTGPNGETGTVPAGTSLPAGWKAAP